MTRAIAVHVVAGILFIGAGAPEAQESIPTPAVVDARDTSMNNGIPPTRNDWSGPNNDKLKSRVLFGLDGDAGIEPDMGAAAAIAPTAHDDDLVADTEGRQNAARPPEDASSSPQDKAGPTRRWIARAMLRLLDSVVGGLAEASGASRR
jgi:hypothetical protein